MIPINNAIPATRIVTTGKGAFFVSTMGGSNSDALGDCTSTCFTGDVCFVEATEFVSSIVEVGIVVATFVTTDTGAGSSAGRFVA